MGGGWEGDDVGFNVMVVFFYSFENVRLHNFTQSIEVSTLKASVVVTASPNLINILAFSSQK